MLTKIFKTSLLFLFFFNLQIASAFEITVKHLSGRVFQKHTSADPYAISEGKYQLSSETSILTFLDGQFFAETEDKIEVRMKEESIVSFTGKSEFEARKGVVGFKNLSGSILIKTPHVDFKLNEGIVVIKSNSVITRICIIKGNCLFERALGSIKLQEGQEIAFAGGKTSIPYKMSDELRYTWYWVDPSKEPSLMN